MDKIRDNHCSGPSGYAEGSARNTKHDYNRKSCGAPVAIKSADHVRGDCPPTIVTLITAWTAHLTGTKASRRRVELRQVDPWRRLPLLAAAGSLTTVYPLVRILIGTNQRTVMLVNEALSKRGVLASKYPIEHGCRRELG